MLKVEGGFSEFWKGNDEGGVLSLLAPRFALALVTLAVLVCRLGTTFILITAVFDSRHNWIEVSAKMVQNLHC